MPGTKRRRRRGPVQYQGPRKAKPPFPINIIFNVKFFYLTFIVVMIASMAAIGLGSGFSSSNNPGAPVDQTTPGPETPAANVFSAPLKVIDATKPYVATIKTNKGDIKIQLSTKAPETVNSFAFLAGKGFYNNTVFFYADHKFWAQAGDPTCIANSAKTCSGVGGPGYTLKIENSDVKHVQWAVVAPVLAEGAQEVHGSQFRILYQADPRLDGKETVFGTVVGGQQILESLPDLQPCSIASVTNCNQSMAGALVIKDVVVQPAS